MKSFVTSYVGLFEHIAENGHGEIEIPLIQRDYAQGRADAKASIIRGDFLDALRDAVLDERPISLDFVYGELDDQGVMRPLDGQQRLTTLFLLHWYLASRSDNLDATNAWTHFSYATRPGARTFCGRLSTWAPEPSDDELSAQIRNQPWYQYGWEHDPTIQSMLVVVDAIDARFRDADPAVAWASLTNEGHPAISFHLLPISDIGSGNDLYIKMNSRGKPLTNFENFKAGFEKLVSWSSRAHELSLNLDTTWADVLWDYRADNDIVDDEFEHYIGYIVQLCEWLKGEIAGVGRLIERAAGVFAEDCPRANESLDFLFNAFDTWRSTDPEQVMGELFDLSPAPDETQRVVIFGNDVNPNLFDACCRDFGTTRFGYPRMLLLYAVLLHRIESTVDFPRRLRILRNLIEASEDELRADRLPLLVGEVRRLVVDGTVKELTQFNQEQVADEERKAEFLASHPHLAEELFHLEDHPVLRGSLASIELDPERFSARAHAFWSVFDGTEHLPEVTAALLTCGDYSRHRQRRTDMFQLGSSSALRWWRELLTEATYANLEATREVLARFLDRVSESTTDVPQTLKDMRAEWLDEHAAGPFDWRHYMIKYDAMRMGTSGIYAVPDTEMGYSLCMLRVTQLNSNYYDPYILATIEAAQASERVQGGEGGPWFTGFATSDRWLRLKESDTGLRCAESGWLLDPPSDDHAEAFASARAGVDGLVETDSGLLLSVPQAEVDGSRIDELDRVQVAARFVRRLIDAGL